MRRRKATLITLFVLSALGGLPGAAASDGMRAEWQILAGPVDPPPMYGHSVIHDPIRHRLAMLNGARVGELWTLSLAADEVPAWSRIPIRGRSFPGVRSNFSAVYDSLGDRVIVFGGSLGNPDDSVDVWALSLGDDPRWVRIETLGESPRSRTDHAAVFDPVRRRMIVFGGYAKQLGYLDDTWELDFTRVPAWRRIATVGRSPGRNKGSRAIYDPWGDRVVLFGGLVQGATNLAGTPTYRRSDETWILPLSHPAEWDSLVIAGRPVGRSNFALALDRERRGLIISGGEGLGGHALSDTWTLSLQGMPTWTAVTTTGTDPGRISSHAAAYSPERGSMIQYGGIRSARQNQAFELNLRSAAWSPIEPDGPSPAPPRRSGGMLFKDAETEQWMLWGGFWWHDLWSFDDRGPAWTAHTTTGAAPTVGARTFIRDVKRNRLISIGGGVLLNQRETLNDIGVMSLDPPRVWSRLDVRGEPPAGRVAFSAIYDPIRDRVLIYGGVNWWHRGSRQSNDLGELWELSLAEPAWKLLQETGAPGKRGGPQALYDPVRDRMLVLGGFTSGYASSHPVTDAWALELGGGSLRWTPLGPSPPEHVEAVFDPLRDRLLAWSGGRDAWTLSLSRPDEWHPVQVSGLGPTPRAQAAIAYDEVGDRLLVFGGGVFGGFPNSSPAGDVHALVFSRAEAAGIAEPSVKGLGIRVETPSRLRLEVRCTLATGIPARLEVFDVAGRRVASENVRASGVAEQRLSLGVGSLTPGVYLLRLTQNGRSAGARAVVLR